MTVNASPKDAALKIALEALEDISSLLTTMTGATFTKLEHAAKVAKEALAGAEGERQLEQEPVWIRPDHLEKAKKAPHYCHVAPTKRHSDFVPIYLTPPQRTWEKPWVSLTDEEANECWDSLLGTSQFTREGITHAIEAKLKEKNT